MTLFDTRERLRERLQATDQASFNDEWPEPKPLPSGLPDVPPFAAELLPAAFRGWVMDVAERMQCPPDYPAVAVNVAAASLIGRQAAIRPKRRDDWTVVPNLWGMTVGRPSLMKSPALQEALMPITAMEVEAVHRHRDGAPIGRRPRWSPRRLRSSTPPNPQAAEDQRRGGSACVGAAGFGNRRCACPPPLHR